MFASPGETDREAGAGIARQAACGRLPAMEFSDEPNYVKSETEMRAAVGIGAGLPQGLEEPVAGVRGQRGAGVVDLHYGAVGLEPHSEDDRRACGTEIHRIINELIEHLHDQVRRSLNLDGLVR